MVIGFNLTAFQPGAMGGMEVYARNILGALQRVDERNRYLIICDRHYQAEFPKTNPNFEPWTSNFTRPSTGWLVRGITRNLLGADILKPVLNRVPADVIHHPFSLLNPRGLSVPSVLTFHDMQHEFFPDNFSPFEMKTRREFYRASAQEATRIVAISGHAKETLVQRYDIDANKVQVVYNGCSPAFRVLSDAADGLDRLRSAHGLSRPFMLYPAGTWPHKNHLALLAALRLMIERYRFDGQLVLTGIARQSNEGIVKEIARLGLEEHVRILGYLPHDELPGLYNMARLLAFPSLFEGFGIPLVEAMACGCPVAASNRTSIPEVLGEAGVLFEPGSVEEMAETLWRLWSDDALRRDLKAKGLRRAAGFSWERAAQETVTAYQKAAGS